MLCWTTGRGYCEERRSFSKRHKLQSGMSLVRPLGGSCGSELVSSTHDKGGSLSWKDTWPASMQPMPCEMCNARCPNSRHG
eukprot:1014148-Amphidinium_carterae.4